MLKTLKELEQAKQSGVEGEDLVRFFAEGTLTLGELMDFVAKFPGCRDVPVEVDGEPCPSLTFGNFGTGEHLALRLLSKSHYLSGGSEVAVEHANG